MHVRRFALRQCQHAAQLCTNTNASVSLCSKHLWHAGAAGGIVVATAAWAAQHGSQTVRAAKKRVRAAITTARDAAARCPADHIPSSIAAELVNTVLSTPQLSAAAFEALPLPERMQVRGGVSVPNLLVFWSNPFAVSQHACRRVSRHS